ncbi:class I SAM-dependent methyltransferase [Chloroflexota bacterium]
MNKNEQDNTTPHKAAHYDVDVRKTVPFYDEFYSQTIDLVKSARPDAKVWLDTGCGTGWLVSEASKHFPNTLFILADPSQSMLDKAKKKLATLPPSQVKFLPPAGTDNIALDDNTKPDVITAIQCHHYLDAATRRIATQKCYDMLSVGGIYITFENIHPYTDEGIKIGSDMWKRYQLSQGRDEKTVDDHIKRFNKAYFPISVIAHVELLKECGFSAVELLWYSHMQAGFYAIK